MNRAGQGDFFVTIDGARGREWIEVLGTATLPIESPEPIDSAVTGKAAEILGTGKLCSFYKMKVDALSGPDRAKVVAYLACKFELTEAEVRADILLYGVPILAEACTVVIMNPQRWL